jgi:hypothetical protein
MLDLDVLLAPSLQDIKIGDTICQVDAPVALPTIKVRAGNSILGQWREHAPSIEFMCEVAHYTEPIAAQTVDGTPA